MNYFTSIQAARDWANSYGYSYVFKILPAREAGLWFVRWDYREPRGA